MDMIWSTLRHAARSLRRSPASTIVAILTLALGVGATTAVYSVARHVVLDPLPYPQPERLTLVWSALETSGYRRAPISGPELTDLRRRVGSFEAVGAIWSTNGALVEGGEPEVLRLGLVSANFLDVLGLAPRLGRTFTADEEGDGARAAVVISGELWQRRFGGDPDVLGRALRIDGGWGFGGGLFEVVGVMPAGVRMVLPADAGVPAAVDAWIPFSWDLAAGDRNTYYLRTVARLRAGVDVQAARREVAAVGEEIAAEHAGYAGQGRSFDLVSLHDDAVAAARPALLALLGGVVFVFLIACANVASLQLVRAADRRRELALRSALGGSTMRLGALLLSEGLMLAVAGGAPGVLAAAGLLTLTSGRLPAQLPRAESIGLDSGVLAFGLAVTVIAGIVFGLAPLVEVFRGRLMDSLRAARSVTEATQRLRRLLVAVEVAVGIVLLVGAALCLESFRRLRAVDPGFDTEGVLTARLNLPFDRYGTPHKIAAFAHDLERELAALPGVRGAGTINQLPLDDLPNWSTGYKFRGADEDAAFEADARVVSPGYLPALGVELVAGRYFRAGDGDVDGDGERGQRPVVIVDTELAAKAWPGRPAVGQELEVRVFDGERFAPRWAEVVGVVEHVRHHDLRQAGREQLYVPFTQGTRNQMALAVRTDGDPSLWREPVRQVLAARDPELASTVLVPLERYRARSTGIPMLTTALAVAFGALALLLAGIGLYGIVAYAVARRTAEIGLRVALGARPDDVEAWVVGQGLRLVLLGTVVGLGAAAALGGAFEAVLFEVDPLHPGILAAVPLLLVAVALVATWLPARRAARVDPLAALRAD